MPALVSAARGRARGSPRMTVRRRSRSPSTCSGTTEDAKRPARSCRGAGRRASKQVAAGDDRLLVGVQRSRSSRARRRARARASSRVRDAQSSAARMSSRSARTSGSRNRSSSSSVRWADRAISSMRSAWRRRMLVGLARLRRAARARTRGSSRASRSAPRRDGRCAAGRGSCRAARRACRGRRRRPPRPTRACSRRERRRARRKSRCSSSSSRSYDQAIVARRVAWRSSASRVPLSRSRLSLEPLEERLGREELRARGGELEREREAVEPRAELGDRRVGLEVGTHGVRALDEERDGLGFGERRQVELDFALDAKRLATRREHPKRGRGRRELRERARGVRGAGARGCPRARACACRRCARRSRRARPTPAPRRSPIVGRTSSGSRSGASATNTVPPSASSASSRASSSAKRVLPVPPGPRIVSTRGSRS